MTDDLIYRLRKRAEIRRQIQTRKSVQEGKPDRIAELLEEAALEIERISKDIHDLDMDYQECLAHKEIQGEKLRLLQEKYKGIKNTTDLDEEDQWLLM